MSRETRISLSEQEFKTLVSGGLVKREGGAGTITISLQDIGIDYMDLALQEARWDGRSANPRLVGPPV